MFGSLFRQAQATVDNAIGLAINRIIVAVPFIVALGFATAALSSWLSQTYGSEASNLILAGGYAVLGLVAALIFSTANGATAAAGNGDTATSAEATATEAASDASPLGFAEADQQLLMTALSTAAPMALPLAIRGLLRNLPLVLVIAVVAFILTRLAEDDVAAPQANAAAPAAE